MTPTGYMHCRYAQSLSEFGTPLELPRCGGWLLERPIGESELKDAMGSYPLFACQDWSRLGADLEEVGRGLISVALVPDPFGTYDEALLKSCFDRVVAFKERFVADLERDPAEFADAHHRYYARWSFKRLSVEERSPCELLADWCSLYAELVERHSIRGIKAFSPASFRGQLRVPGIVAFRAFDDQGTIAAQLWYVQGDVAYSHLTASSARGYKLRVQYALYWSALNALRGRARWAELGAGAGVEGGTSGLTEFKRGWATGTRPGWFCGRVFQPDAYATLSAAAGETSYFPAYRAGELA